MRSKYIFIITLIIFSFSGLLMAQFNLLSKEGREAAKKAAEEIKLLEEKHSALLKKNIEKFGTIYNTVKLSCTINGTVTTKA